jgi:hypothetical protein
MPRLEFNRVDLQIVIRRSVDGGASVFSGRPGALERTDIWAKTISSWLDLAPGELIPDLDVTLHLEPAFAEWFDRLQQPPLLNPSGPSNSRTLARLTLEIEDRALAGLAWEESLWRHLQTSWSPAVDTCIERVSQVLPRFATIPLTLPVRILHQNPEPAKTITLHVRSLFGSQSDAEVERVVRMQESAFDETGVASLPAEWPTIEVLHFARLPTLAGPEFLMTTASADAAGTLGWLSRRTDTWQTRLVIIETQSPSEFATARRLGQALIGRGGPAVLVTGPTIVDETTRWFHFYDLLIHDSPHDYNIASVFPGSTPVSLFGGAGREDALRFSNVGLGLMQLEDDIETIMERDDYRLDQRSRALGERDEEGAKRSGEVWPGEASLSPERALAERDEEDAKRSGDPRPEGESLRSELGRLRSEWDSYWFEDHEQGGVLPMAARLADIRRAANLSGPAGARVTPRAATPWRYINSSLWDSTVEGGLQQLSQRCARLTVGETYQLCIQIGPQDVHVQTVGATAVIEEVFKWTPEMEGVWLEVGVSGLDFEVLGAPVQELWMPRDSTSDPLFFAVVPRRQEVACLRFSVYLKQNVIQSFRLAALTHPTSEQKETTPELRRALLAGALDLPREAIGDVSYLPRLDYSTAANVQTIMSRPARGLSIVANEVAGRKAITLKGPDLFAVQIPKDLKDYVTKVRGALKSISTPPVPGVSPEKWGYPWGLPGGGQNAGTPKRLKDSLKQLAEAGWQLFDRIIPRFPADGNNQDSQRQELCRLLDEKQQVIHVAHTLLDDVLPWSALYDRLYDPEKETEKGEPVAHDACLAALPTPDGNLPFTKCGTSPQCLLSEQQKTLRREQGQPLLVSDTVACPLHFWGFKHLVEMPAQQVSEAAGSATEQQDCILPDGQLQLALGYNPHFAIYQKHLDELDKVTSGPPPTAVWKARKFLRDDVVEMLQDVTLDFIYLYCHAYASREENFFPPFLEFGQAGKPARIRSDQLDFATPWKHHPLVFLNGCGTAGFNPEAISPFIEKFVRDRKAAGVIGTEIPVWEQLATEFARSFLENFLRDDSAGVALLRARRVLLAQNNPLGLVYTLYGPSHLKIARDGKCDPDV